jgi:hypothetical protein
LTLFQKLVCKVDQLVKRRAKSGLIRVNVDWSDAKEFINQHLGKEIKVRSSSSQELLKCSWTVKSERKLQSCLKLIKSQNPFCHILEILNKNYGNKNCNMFIQFRFIVSQSL